MEDTDIQEMNTVYIDPATDNEEDIERKAEIIDGRLYKPGMFRPGQSGNPAGRPKGKTLKEWVREYLACMSDTERIAFLDGIPKDVVWRLAEGNPTEDKNIKISVPQPILGGITQLENGVDTSSNTQPS